MSNFQKQDDISDFEPIRNEFGQAMFGLNWLEFANDRDGNIDLPPYMLDRNAMTCPIGNTCSLVPGTNGMYVRSDSDSKIYFSIEGYRRFKEGANTDKASVAKDLLKVIGGSLGGMAPGFVGLIAQALEIGSYAIDCWLKDNC
jgi:hypothetical protein